MNDNVVIQISSFSFSPIWKGLYILFFLQYCFGGDQISHCTGCCVMMNHSLNFQKRTEIAKRSWTQWNVVTAYSPGCFPLGNRISVSGGFGLVTNHLTMQWLIVVIIYWSMILQVSNLCWIPRTAPLLLAGLTQTSVAFLQFGNASVSGPSLISSCWHGKQGIWLCVSPHAAHSPGWCQSQVEWERVSFDMQALLKALLTPSLLLSHEGTCGHTLDYYGRAQRYKSLRVSC